MIVLAATNRADTLDAALLRPGRFDRRVPVDLPDVKGRLEILKVHAKGKPLAAEVDLGIVAKRTTGFSGASLANLMNEAAIVAARRDMTTITYEHIDYSIDRVTVGMQKTTGMTFPARQRLVAYHEAGHALMGLLTPDYDMVTKVTIIPRTNGAGGFTLFTPSEERLESGARRPAPPRLLYHHHLHHLHRLHHALPLHRLLRHHAPRLTSPSPHPLAGCTRRTT